MGHHNQNENLVEHTKDENIRTEDCSNVLFPSLADGTHMRASKIDVSSRSFWKIEPSFLPSKITYFLLDFTNGCIIPFLVPFLSSIGLNMREIGFIAGMRFIASSVASPFWGYLADCTGKSRYIFLILCFGAAITIFPMPWIAHTFKPPINNSEIILPAGDGWTIEDKFAYPDTNISHLSNDLDLAFGVNNRSNKASLISYQRSFASTNLFYVMFTLVFISSFFTNSLICFVDSFVMNVVKSHSDDNYYGMQKLFGAIGFAIASFLAGVICDLHLETSTSTYTPAFCVFLPFVLLLMPCGYKLSTQTTVIENDDKIVNKWALFLSTFRCIDNMIFLVTAFIMGIAQAVAYSFLLKLLEDEANASKTIMGLAHLIASVSEMVIFFLSKKILKLCGGNIGGIELAVFAYFVRYLIFSFNSNILVILPLQVLSSLSFALYWAAALEYTQSIASNAIYLSIFSMINNTYYNIAGVTGTICGGLFYDRYSGRALFRATSYLCGGWFLIMVLYHHLFRRFYPRFDHYKDCKKLSEKPIISEVA